MYAAAFGLAQEPFSIAPDPRFLFMSERHREALAHLLYGVRGGGGFVLLTGEVGAGKTTVCRCFLEQIPKRCNVAYVFNPKLSALELLQAVCDEFHLTVAARAEGAPTLKDHVDALNRFLLDTHAVGHSSVLIIDEAQNLTADVLEQLRLLTNLETNERKLLQVVLIGQPELRTMLARPDLEQVAQRVIARYHLDALTADETVQYVHHRLAVAGARRRKLFDAAALARVHALSRGVPRRINLLADRALLGAYAGGRTRVDAATVERAAAEVFGTERREAVRSRWRTAAVAGGGALAGAALLGAALWGLGPNRRPPAPLAAVPPTPAASVPAAPASSAAAAGSAPAVAVADAAIPWPVLADEAPAWRELAPAWSLAAGDGDACAAAAGAQLRCFRGKGDLALVRQLARPVIVTLRGDDARPAYAVLTGLQGGRATLRAAGQARSVAAAELAARWSGEFATFWRVPPGYADAVLDLQPGPATDWLVQQLARVPGLGAIDATRPRDAALRERVRAFQAAQGLPADGLAGPLTLMQLNRLAGVDEPRLDLGRLTAMSYILDALRRADAERARGSVPDLHAQPLGFAPAAGRAGGPRWVWPAAALLALAGVAALAWFGWGGSAAPEPPAVVPPPVAVAPVVAPSIAPVPAAPVASAPVAAGPAPPAAAATLPMPAPEPTPPVAAARPAKPVAARPTRMPAAASPPAESRVWQTFELPAELRRDLPALRFGGAIHSPDPASRLLIVDGLLLREGEEAAPGVRIREIRKTSVVVEFRGRWIELGL